MYLHCCLLGCPKFSLSSTYMHEKHERDRSDLIVIDQRFIFVAIAPANDQLVQSGCQLVELISNLGRLRVPLCPEKQNKHLVGVALLHNLQLLHTLKPDYPIFVFHLQGHGYCLFEFMLIL